MSAYDALAASYDGLMADGAYRRRAAFLERRLKKTPFPVETVLLAAALGVLCRYIQGAKAVNDDNESII